MNCSILSNFQLDTSSQDRIFPAEGSTRLAGLMLNET